MNRIAFYICMCVGMCSATAQTTEDTLKAFRKDCGAKAAAAEAAGKIVVPGKNGWLFLEGELRHVSVGMFWGQAAAKVSRATRPDAADPLPAILDFHEQLEKLGIQLIMVPVPAKAFVYPEEVSDAVPAADDQAPPRLDTAHQEFYELLRAEGITIVDLLPTMLEHRADDATMYCKQDTHWSGQACVLAAQLVAQQIKDQLWYQDAPKNDYSCEERTIEITGDLWRSLQTDTPPKEEIPLRFVGKKQATGLTPVEPNRDSPVILMGDSHTLIFHSGQDMQATGAGLADQLAFELDMPVDLIGVRGSGATSARINLYRRGRSDKTYFDNKKILVWCFTVREFTESSGWRLVPVKR